MGGRVRGWGQGRCKRCREAFVKIKKKIFFRGGSGRLGGRVGGSAWGVRVDFKEELKFL